MHRQPPPPIGNFPFSNDWLNFKHLFWAAQGQEKGIFAAFHSSMPQIN
jgi:hypothetical protein